MRELSEIQVRPNERSLPAELSVEWSELPVEVDPRLLHLVAAVLSIYVGTKSDKKAHDVYELKRALRDYSVLAGLIGVPPASGRALTILRKRGLTRREVRQRWGECRSEQGRTAILDVDLLVELFPQPFWVALAQLIIDGSALAVERTERLLLEVEGRSVRPTTARPDGGRVSQGVVVSYSSPLSFVMRTLCELGRRGFPCALLDGWRSVPRLNVPRVAAVDTDRSAPPRSLVRRGWQSLDGRIKEKLGAETDDEELDCVYRLAPARLRSAGVWRLARNRAMYALLCVLGSRTGAVCFLRRSDLRSDHVGPDGRIGPAIALRPGKGYDEGEVHWKAIPRGVLRVIEVYLAITDKILAGTPNYGPHGPESRRRQGPGDPLFIGRLAQPHREITDSVMYQFLVGRRARPEKRRRGTSAFLPKPHGGGYSPHTLRSSALQMTREGARDHCQANNLPYDPDAIAEALIDHEISSDRYGYADLNSARGRERLSGIATKLTWEFVVTDRGARKQRDVAGFEAALHRHSVIEDELARRRKDRDEIVLRHRDAKTVPVELLLALVADDEGDVLRAELAAVEEQLERLRHDPATLVPIPDDADDQEPTDDFADVEQRFAARSEPRSEPEASVPVRNWFTVPELGYIAEMSPAQAARWANGQHLPHRPGDPRRPWEPDAVPIDRSLGPRRRRICVDGINPGFLRSASTHRRLDEVLAEWPRGWKEEDCRTPITWERER